MIRTYPEMQQVMRRIEAIVHRFIPDAEVKIVPSDTFYASTYISPFPSESKKVIIRFSQMLIESGTWEQIEDTVAHEIAHVMSADRDNKSAANSGWHTREWSDIARALGASGGIGDYYPDVLYPPKYKYRCADCGYTANVSEERHRMPATSPGEISILSSDVAIHGIATGHHKWYVLDELTGKRFTETISDS
jgi:hypothetical protein